MRLQESSAHLRLPAHIQRLMTSTSTYGSVISVGILAICIKVLFLPAPHSTDLEVHRHWKALTYNLPLSQWYTDISSVWTLDYPPLFAYFECMLAHVLAWIHPRLLDLSNHNYAAPAAVAALRLTVLAWDPLLISAAVAFQNQLVPVFFVLLNPALIIVDNIHFQYNLVPIALLLYTLSALKHDRIPLAAATFTLAVNLKHTLLPLSLPLICHVLATLPRMPSPALTFLRTAGVTLLIMLCIWIPFIQAGRRPLIEQIFARLFPFNRGLLHANWAPNFWAVYAVADKALSRLGLAVRVPDGPITRGVIGAMRPFATLPNPTPGVCNALTILACTPCLAHNIRNPCSATAVRAAAATALAYALFGWHVHEKALLVPLVLLAGSACRSVNDGVAFAFLAPAAHVAVLGLVARGSAAAAARMLVLAYHGVLLGAVAPAFGRRARAGVVAYSVVGVVVEMYAHGGGHEMAFGERMGFAPLIVAALYSVVGVSVAFVVLCVA